MSTPNSRAPPTFQFRAPSVTSAANANQPSTVAVGASNVSSSNRSPSPTSSDFLLPSAAGTATTDSSSTNDAASLADSATPTPTLPSPIQRAATVGHAHHRSATSSSPAPLHLGAPALGGVTSHTPTQAGTPSNDANYSLAPYRNNSNSAILSASRQSSGGANAPSVNPTPVSPNLKPLNSTTNTAATAAATNTATTTSTPSKSVTFSQLSSRKEEGTYAAPSSSSDRAPLLSSFNNSDDADSGEPVGKSSAQSYFEQYEATVNKIRQKRADDEAKQAKAKDRSPEQTKKELRYVGAIFFAVLLLVGMIIFILYPRIPDFGIKQVRIDVMRLWSDGTAEFSIATHVDLHNANFMSTGIETMSVSVAHNNTVLGNTQVGALKLLSRHSNDLVISHDFSPVSVPLFAEMFEELSATEGDLTLDYSVDIVTSENFRLRNIQVLCTIVVQIIPISVPPKSQVLSSDCTHSEQTG